MTCICAQIRVMGKGTPLVYRSSEDSGPPHPIGAWEGRVHALAQITPPPQVCRLRFSMQVVAGL